MKLRLLAILTLALIAVPALAQEELPGQRRGNDLRERYESHRQEVRAEMEAKRAELQMKAEERAQNRATASEDREESKADREANRNERREDVVARHLERTALRFTATVERMMNIIERIESRIEKIQERGGDTTEAEVAVEAAVADLVAAEVNITTLEGISLDGDNFQVNLALVKEGAIAIKANLRSAHTNMMLAVRALKGPNTGVDQEQDDGENDDPEDEEDEEGDDES